MVAARATFDVIIVGGGPAGSATAIQPGARRPVGAGARAEPAAAGQGVRRVPEPGCDRHAQERLALRSLLADVPQRDVRAIAIVSPGGHRVVGSFGSARGLSIARADLDHALVRGARALGAHVLEGASVSGIARDASGVSVTWAEDTVLGEARAPLVVGADGRFSIVARRLGLQRRPRAGGRAVIHGRFGSCGGRHDRVEMYLLPGRRYLGLNQLPDGALNASLVVDLADLKQRQRVGCAQLLREAIARSPALAHVLGDATLSDAVAVLAPLLVQPAATFAERVLLVGDAAGFRDPLTGEGIDQALRGAELAARWCSTALARQRFDARLLAGYGRERRRAFAAKDALNCAFQWLLARPALQSILGARLERSRSAADALVRVIGNVCSPWTLLAPSFLTGLLRVPEANGFSLFSRRRFRGKR
ncbi:MAG: NAD(P)/FAD-dependent oxidoreductase [Planctomycetota bacterium]